MSISILFQNFTATETIGNLTLHEQSVTYHVQVSATVRTTGGLLRQTELSPITPRATLFVPLPSKEMYWKLTLLRQS